ncbi:hypothetical protein [Parafrankia discariae]|uniref:hypothetical protein n=1 Tax=Parafrankia discariae TaxID=365528 RepID=UPI0003A010EF|nr:hypothetical protein [Parafrankia discariae]
MAEILENYGLTYSTLVPAVARKTGKTEQAAYQMVRRQLGGSQKRQIDWWILGLLFDRVPGEEGLTVREKGRRLYVQAYPVSPVPPRDDDLPVPAVEVAPTLVNQMVREVSSFLATAAADPARHTVDSTPAPQTSTVTLDPAPPPPVPAAPAEPTGREPGPAAEPSDRQPEIGPAAPSTDLDRLRKIVRELKKEIAQYQGERDTAITRLLRAKAERREAVRRHQAHIHKLLDASHLRQGPHTDETPTRHGPDAGPLQDLTYPAYWLLPPDLSPAVPDPVDPADPADPPTHKDRPTAADRLQHTIADLRQHARRIRLERDKAITRRAWEVAALLEGEHHYNEHVNELATALRRHQDSPTRRAPIRRILGPDTQQTDEPPR